MPFYLRPDQNVEPRSSNHHRMYVIRPTSIRTTVLIYDGSVFSSLRVHALAGRHWPLTVTVLILSLSPVPCNIVSLLAFKVQTLLG